MLDLRDYPMPFYDEVLIPTRLNSKYSNETVLKWVKKIGEADGYIIATPEYNHGYPAILKNAIDYPFAEWNKKPVAFISWGGVGGARAVEQLRQVVIELQMAPIKNSINIIAPWNLLDENGNLREPLKEGADNLFDQLIWWVRALKNAREADNAKFIQ